MELFRLDLPGRPVQLSTEHGPLAGSPAAALHLLGVDVTALALDDGPRTVVQLLFDDDQPGFDATLLDAPLVAELLGPGDAVLAREPFDHDRFRWQLSAERAIGESTTRGVLVLTAGELPPPWIRLAFLPVDIATTKGTTLAVRRTTVPDLVGGADEAFARGELTDAEHRAVLLSIEQRHPDPGSFS
ncbi:MAG TPA: hypothetical protein VGM93_08485 [Acidimicrobiales bacterium]